MAQPSNLLRISLSTTRRAGRETRTIQQPRYQLWLACFFIFGATFGLTPWNEGSARPRRIQLALLAVQAVTALVMLVLVCSGHEGALLVLVAAQLGWFMSLRRALLWVVIQAVLMGAILALGWPLAEITRRRAAGPLRAPR
jgi:hypothetical protein